MTGAASEKSLFIMDFENQKNQEWLRRRKLRLEQVRKQSNEIARALREKILRNEKARLDLYDRISEEKLEAWKAEKLEELENKLMYALEEFGEGYRLAEEEASSEKIMEEQQKINFEKAIKRGELAAQEEIKRKKEDNEKKMSPIVRKKVTRKKEDLRSALIRTLPVKKQLISNQEVQTYEEDFKCDKSHSKKLKNKKVATKKPCKCKRKSLAPVSKESDSVWINLDDVQCSSITDSALQSKNCKSSNSLKTPKEKPEGMVEFYDFSSRYYSRSFREFPHLVEKIHPEAEVPNASELAKIEEQKEKVEAEKKVEIDCISQERGIEALRKEKIKRDYNDMLTKLEDLTKKEKILKSLQKNQPNFFHMTDERLSERAKSKQLLMESKFESIFYDAQAHISSQPEPVPFLGGGDYKEPINQPSERLSSPPSNLKFNTPVSSSEAVSSISSSEKRSRKPKKRQLLLNIDKALQEGRELRKTFLKNQEVLYEREAITDEPDECLKKKVEEKLGKNVESQTEELKVEDFLDDKAFTGFGSGDDSIPFSTATSYKSPPSVIHSYYVQELLDCLRDARLKAVASCTDQSKRDEAIIEKLEDLVENIFVDDKELKKKRYRPNDQNLRYYVKKLLRMTRECIENLDVSSEDVSTPNITDLEGHEYSSKYPPYKDGISEQRVKFWSEILADCKTPVKHIPEESECQYQNLSKSLRTPPLRTPPQEPPCVHKPRLPRTPQSGSSSTPRSRVPTEVSEEVIFSPVEPFQVMNKSGMQNKYEEISRQCAERIAELTRMLNQVKLNKAKYFTPSSGGSSPCPIWGRRLSFDDEDEVETPVVSSGRKRTQAVEIQTSTPTKPSPRHSPRPEAGPVVAVAPCIPNVAPGSPKAAHTTPIAAPGSPKAAPCAPNVACPAPDAAEDDIPEFPDDTMGTFPDVQEYLMKKKIITEPFNWNGDDELHEFSVEKSVYDENMDPFMRDMERLKRCPPPPTSFDDTDFMNLPPLPNPKKNQQVSNSRSPKENEQRNASRSPKTILKKTT